MIINNHETSNYRTTIRFDGIKNMTVNRAIMIKSGTLFNGKIFAKDNIVSECINSA